MTVRWPAWLFSLAILWIWASLAASQQMPAESLAVLRSCDADRIARHKLEMMAQPDAATARLDDIDRILSALKKVELARKLAQRRLDSGAFEGAGNVLRKAIALLANLPEVQGCPALRTELERQATAALQVAATAQQADEALQACDLGDLRRAKSVLLRIRNEQLSPLSARIETAIGLSLRLEAARREAGEGRYERASESLAELIAQAGEPAPVCAGLLDRVRALQDQIRDTGSRLAVLDAARQTCTAAAIDDAVEAQASDDRTVAARIEALKAFSNTIKSFVLHLDRAKRQLSQAGTVAAIDAALQTLAVARAGIPEEAACDPQRATLTRQATMAGDLRQAVVDADSVLRKDCSPQRLQRLADAAGRYGGYAAMDAVQVAVTKIRDVQGMLADRLPGLLQVKDFAAAGRALSDAESLLADVPESYCRDAGRGGGLRTWLSARRADLALVSGLLEGLDGMAKACRMAAIDNTISGLQRRARDADYPAGFSSELGKLRTARSSCEISLRRQRLEAETRACRTRLGSQGYAFEASGAYGCTCQSPYQLNGSGTRCVKPRYMVEREANDSCRAGYGDVAYAVDIGEDGTYNCRCGSGHTFIEGTTKCVKPTRSQLKKLARASCRQQYGQLARETNLKSIDDYQCTCAGTARWDSSGTKCYQPTRKERLQEGWTSCRATYGRRLFNVTLAKNGTAICHYYLRK